jgi:hypothetical protein
MNPWMFNLKPEVTPEDPDVTPAYLMESYQKVLNSKVQLQIIDGDEITVVDAIDQNGQAVTVKDVLQVQ